MTLTRGMVGFIIKMEIKKNIEEIKKAFEIEEQIENIEIEKEDEKLVGIKIVTK